MDESGRFIPEGVKETSRDLYRRVLVNNTAENKLIYNHATQSSLLWAVSRGKGLEFEQWRKEMEAEEEARDI